MGQISDIEQAAMYPEDGIERKLSAGHISKAVDKSARKSLSTDLHKQAFMIPKPVCPFKALGKKAWLKGRGQST